MSSSVRRVLLIGLDSAPPELLFGPLLEELPTLRALVDRGVYGPLKSTIPPITVPAWMCMVTGMDPGTLGIYGLRNRPDYSYRPMQVASSGLVSRATLWDELGARDKRVILVGVPLTYPPRAVNGSLIASFLAPGPQSNYTFPPELKTEIDRIAGGYELDVAHFRTDDKPRLLDAIYSMTRKRFRVTRHLMTSREWDFLMHVEMGTDRINHGFWRHHDPGHRHHDPTSPFTNAIRDYYRYLDGEIASLIDLAGEDTAVMVVSDHGAKRIDGGICINEWLIDEGFLKLEAYPSEATPIEDLAIDWAHTSAWGYGGYYARIFLNVEGREPAGIVQTRVYEDLRSEISEKLSSLPDAEGRPLATRVFRPQDVYQECRGVPPDLIVYFGDLHWRSVGSVGTRSVYARGNDTGPDDANHSEYGVFLLSGIDGLRPELRNDLDILDIAPTVLSAYGLPVPKSMQGRSLLPATVDVTSSQQTDGDPRDETSPYTDDEQQQVMDRLKSLGYL